MKGTPAGGILRIFGAVGVAPGGEPPLPPEVHDEQPQGPAARIFLSYPP